MQILAILVIAAFVEFPLVTYPEDLLILNNLTGMSEPAGRPSEAISSISTKLSFFFNLHFYLYEILVMF